MKAQKFIGRRDELNQLTRLFRKKSASLVVIQGRRRVGKSRLVQEFGKNYHFYQLSGLPPSSQTTAQSQRDEIMYQLCQQAGLPNIKLEDWTQIFSFLARETRQGKTVILLDEISWMGSKDPDFLGKLKNAWDMHFKENPELILILCGSLSIWIEENILNSTGFMGRISLVVNMKELSLKDSQEFLETNSSGKKTQFRSAYEVFKILSITGGIPRYLEEIDPGLTAEENIRQLCFLPGGVLVREFNDIFSDLFSKRSELYKQIVYVLADGPREYNDLCQTLSLSRNGHLLTHLDNLIKSGFITRDYTWHLTSGKVSRLSHYRLSDNYIRFYLKYIENNHDKIQAGHFSQRSIGSLPGWESIMGLQFENLILNNRVLLWKKLSIFPEDIVSDNPFFQRKTTVSAGCQIDYLIHAKYNTIYVIEIKFSKNPLSSQVIKEVQEKIQRLKRPKGFSYIPVLLHVNGVQESVIEKEYFKEIIDFEALLEYTGYE